MRQQSPRGSPTRPACPRRRTTRPRSGPTRWRTTRRRRPAGRRPSTRTDSCSVVVVGVVARAVAVDAPPPPRIAAAAAALGRGAPATAESAAAAMRHGARWRRERGREASTSGAAAWGAIQRARTRKHLHTPWGLLSRSSPEPLGGEPARCHEWCSRPRSWGPAAPAHAADERGQIQSRLNALTSRPTGPAETRCAGGGRL